MTTLRNKSVGDGDLGHSTTYSYDPTGNLSSVTDALGHVTTFAHDSMNRLSSSTDPLGRTESYQYDLNGNLVRKVKRDGAAIDFLYDAANQLLDKRSLAADGLLLTAHYSYDVNGNLTSVTNSDSSVSFDYDPLDRVIRTQSSILGAQSASMVDYTYDPVGNRLSVTTDGSLLTAYSYDAMNRLIQLTNPEILSWHFSYDLAGRRTRLTYPNGILTTYSYDAASRLLSLHHDQSGSPVAHFDYAYDPVGNRIQKGEIDGSTGYSYDALSRLTSASTTIPGLPQEFYSYDAVGNRISSYLSNFHSHDAANQLLEDDSYTYQYDANGNQIGKVAKNGSERWVYAYDAENQLVGVQRFAPAWEVVPTMIASYGYDGLGRRISKNLSGLTGSLAPGLTTYVYDNEDILSLAGTKVTHGPEVDEPLRVGDFTLVQDGLGSVVAEIPSTGMSRFSFESYGTTKPLPSQPYGFTGREFDPETGLHFHRARYYDPARGTFLQRDPLLEPLILPQKRRSQCRQPFGSAWWLGWIIRWASADPTILPASNPSFGPYEYALNNPLRFLDPWGLQSCEDCRALCDAMDCQGGYPPGEDRERCYKTRSECQDYCVGNLGCDPCEIVPCVC